MRSLPAPTRLDRILAYLAPGYALRRRVARMSLSLIEASTRRYRGAELSRLNTDWISSVISDATPPPWELDTLRERSRDLNRNDPVAAGATDTISLNVVGAGLTPQSRLRAEALGLTEDQAQQLRRRLEGIFDQWMALADASGRSDFQELQFLAIRKIIEDGEVLALPVFLPDEWRPLGRAVEMIEADRLASPPGRDGVIQGVELGEYRQPVRYWLLKSPTVRRDYEIARREYVGIPARDGRGRPMVLHLFMTKRPGQVRGVPYFAPIISYFKDLADYLEAEVVAARVAACLAVFITKADPYLEAQAQASGAETGTGRRLQELQPGLINYLNVGEQIQVVDPKRGGETFNSFVEGLLRIIGIALGLPYELLVKDFSKTNYSSARAALLEGRRLFTHWRSWFARRFCQPLWELVLEEAWLRGLIPEIEDFYAVRHELCRAQWIGGSWGWVDPVKEVEASKLAVDYGLSTLAEEAAGQGRDWEEILDQRQREEQRIKELGLYIPKVKEKAVPNAELSEKSDKNTIKRITVVRDKDGILSGAIVEEGKVNGRHAIINPDTQCITERFAKPD